MSEHQPMELPSQEVLSRLARDDPQAFEELRGELIANCIDCAANRLQPRLRGLQFRVDCIRRLSRSPLGAAVRIHALMWESFLRMDEELQSFVQLPRQNPSLPDTHMGLDYRPQRSAQIIPFRPRQPNRTG